MCDRHYKRTLQYGDPGSAEIGKLDGEAPGYVNKNGYKILFRDGKQVKEHRYIMAEYLKRPLLPHETVHHINGVRHDNRIENLELWSTSQPYGQRVEDKVEWAIQLLQTYRPEALQYESQSK
jgi:hypothetical protein